MQGEAELWTEVAEVFGAVGHPARVGALLSIYYGDSMTDVADAVGIQRQSLQPHVERLIDAGLMYRPETETGPYALTPLGQFFAVFIEEYGPILHGVFTAIDEAETEAQEEYADLPVSEETRERMVTERKWELVSDQMQDLLATIDDSSE